MNECKSCEKLYCDNCMYIDCDICNKFVCDSCRIHGYELLYCCNVCDKNLCLSCIEAETCGNCNDLVCKKCVKYCNYTCDGVSVYCLNCIPDETGYVNQRGSNIKLCECKNIYCNECSMYCEMCNKTLCYICHYGDDNVCKKCKSNIIIYKKNIITDILPVELVNRIIEYIRC
jgi:hypothetical protein